MNINQLKLEVHDTYKKDEKLTTDFEAVHDKDVINKAYLDKKLKKIDGHTSHIEKYYNECKLQYNKQSVEDILIQKAVKTTIQIFYDNGLFDNFQNADKVLEDFLFTTRHREDLKELNDNLNDFVHKHNLKKEAASNIKLYEVLKKIGLVSKVGIYFRDGDFLTSYGIVNLHPSRGTHWLLYNKDCFFWFVWVFSTKKTS